MTRAAAIFSILIGISVLGMWTMIILTGGIVEGLVEISFHLASEFLMAFLLLISGVGLLRNRAYARKVFLVADGMLIYSVLNAAGYYGDRGEFVMLCMFVAICIIAAVFLVSALVNDRFLTGRALR